MTYCLSIPTDILNLTRRWYATDTKNSIKFLKDITKDIFIQGRNINPKSVDLLNDCQTTKGHVASMDNFYAALRVYKMRHKLDILSLNEINSLKNTLSEFFDCYRNIIHKDTCKKTKEFLFSKDPENLMVHEHLPFPEEKVYTETYEEELNKEYELKSIPLTQQSSSCNMCVIDDFKTNLKENNINNIIYRDKDIEHTESKFIRKCKSKFNKACIEKGYIFENDELRDKAFINAVIKKYHSQDAETIEYAKSLVKIRNDVWAFLELNDLEQTLSIEFYEIMKTATLLK